jgi:hypothetical protein
MLLVQLLLDVDFDVDVQHVHLTDCVHVFYYFASCFMLSALRMVLAGLVILILVF